MRAKLKETDPEAVLEQWQLHDFRRTSRTPMSRAGVSHDIAERCLGRAIGGVRAVYERHKFIQEMAAAFKALSALIGNITTPSKGGKVVAFQR